MAIPTANPTQEPVSPLAPCVSIEDYKHRIISIPRMLREIGLAPSRTEAERLLKTGAISINGTVVTKPSWGIIYFSDNTEGHFFA